MNVVDSEIKWNDLAQLEQRLRAEIRARERKLKQLQALLSDVTATLRIFVRLGKA